MWINKRVEEPGGGDCLLVHGLFDQQGTQYQWCYNGSNYHYQYHSGEYILRDDIATEFTALIDHNHGNLGARDHAETQQNSIGPLYDSQCWCCNTKNFPKAARINSMAARPSDGTIAPGSICMPIWIKKNGVRNS